MCEISGAHAVVAQPAGVDRVRDEVVAEGVHLHQRRHARRCRRSRSAYSPWVSDGQDAGSTARITGSIRPASFSRRNGNASPPKLEPPPVQPTIRSGRLADLGQLQQRLLADDRLVQQHVVEHAAEGVVGVRVAARPPRPPRRSRCRASRGVRVLGQDRAAGRGELATGDGCTVAAEGLHHDPPVRLLVVATRATCQTSHSRPNCAQANASAVPHWPAPVSVVSRRTPGLGVVVRLRHGGVRLVRAGRRDALVLVVDPRRRAERLLQPVRPVQRATAATAGRRRAPRPGCRCTARSITSCRISVHREQRRQVVRARPAVRCPGAAAAAAASAGRG